jgi:hypothetical protein
VYIRGLLSLFFFRNISLFSDRFKTPKQTLITTGESNLTLKEWNNMEVLWTNRIPGKKASDGSA